MNTAIINEKYNRNNFALFAYNDNSLMKKFLNKVNNRDLMRLFLSSKIFKHYISNNKKLRCSLSPYVQIFFRSIYGYTYTMEIGLHSNTEDLEELIIEKRDYPKETIIRMILKGKQLTYGRSLKEQGG